MNKREHYKKQISYFGHEFSRIKEYSLKPWQLSHLKRIKKSFNVKNYKSKTLIDIGTGSGYVAIEMAKLGFNVIACDLTREALNNIARFKKQLKLKNIKLIECKAEKIPIKKHSVDFVVANALLEHIPNEQEAIEEWKRILKPDGKMYITVPLKYRYVWPFFWPINYIHDKKIGHLRRYDTGDLRKKFGFVIKDYFYTGHFLKVAGTILSILLRTEIFLKLLEDWDNKVLKKRFGASNVAVVFENKK